MKMILRKDSNDFSAERHSGGEAINAVVIQKFEGLEWEVEGHPNPECPKTDIALSDKCEILDKF